MPNDLLEQLSALLNLPDLDDMDYDPEGVFKSLTGMDNPHATTQDCMAVVLDMVTSKAFELSSKCEGTQNSGQTYTYVETDFIKALKYGYVVECERLVAELSRARAYHEGGVALGGVQTVVYGIQSRAELVGHDVGEESQPAGVDAQDGDVLHPDPHRRLQERAVAAHRYGEVGFKAVCVEHLGRCGGHLSVAPEEVAERAVDEYARAVTFQMRDDFVY